MRQTHKDHGLDEATLRHLYLGLLLTDKEIGERYGLSDAGVGEQ